MTAALRAYALRELDGVYESLGLADLWEAAAWPRTRGKPRERPGGRALEARLRELVRTWGEIPGEYARRIAKEEMDRTEAEIAALDARPEFARQLRDLQKELVAVYKAASRARAEEDPLAKGRLLRALVERIDCSFTYREVKGGKLYSQLDR